MTRLQAVRQALLSLFAKLLIGISWGVTHVFGIFEWHPPAWIAGVFEWATDLSKDAARRLQSRLQDSALRRHHGSEPVLSGSARSESEEAGGDGVVHSSGGCGAVREARVADHRR